MSWCITVMKQSFLRYKCGRFCFYLSNDPISSHNRCSSHFKAVDENYCTRIPINTGQNFRRLSPFFCYKRQIFYVYRRKDTAEIRRGNPTVGGDTSPGCGSYIGLRPVMAKTLLVCVLRSVAVGHIPFGQFSAAWPCCCPITLI